jgi:transcriptional regulator with XRE-family HTH domain
MEIETRSQEFSDTPTNPDKKQKSHLRMKYEAERVILQKKLGGLEGARKSLGLSRRKICQLLLVDPSAWTRWTKDDGKAPPHIYRALQWYIELVEKKPEWSPQNSFHPYIDQFQPKLDKQWDEIQVEVEKTLSRIKNHSDDVSEQMESTQQNWEIEKRRLESKIEKKDASLAVWKMIVLIHSCVFFFTLLWWIL